jgi:flagellar protein FlaG
MSVELTTGAIDTLPAKLPNGQGNDHQAISNPANSQADIESELTKAKGKIDLDSVDKMGKNETQDEDRVMSRPQLEKVAEQLHEFIGQMNRGLEFSVDKDSGRDVIKVLDKTSGELIKQYPTEEVLSLVAKLSEATGNFVDSKV